MAEEKKNKKPGFQEDNEVLVRIFSYDIPGSKALYVGLTKIKGVKWAIANALIRKLKLDKTKKIAELTKPEIQEIEDNLRSLDIPRYMKNRPSDPETGKSTHLYSVDLDMAREFDIKRMKAMKSYKGVRHAKKLPVRGQRTRSNFRKKSQAAQMKKTKK